MVNSICLVSITQQRSVPHIGEDAKLDTWWEPVATGCCTSSQNLWSRSGHGKKSLDLLSLQGYGWECLMGHVHMDLQVQINHALHRILTSTCWIVCLMQLDFSLCTSHLSPRLYWSILQTVCYRATVQSCHSHTAEKPLITSPLIYLRFPLTFVHGNIVQTDQKMLYTREQ